MTIEISLIYRTFTEYGAWSMFFIITIVIFYLFIFYWVFTEYAAADRLSLVSHLLLI